jgi:hypothetical protein
MRLSVEIENAILWRIGDYPLRPERSTHTATSPPFWRSERIIRGAMTNDQIIQALAEQAYLFQLIVRTLRERGLLQQGEPVSRWNDPEFQKFVSDFRNRYAG